MTTEQLRALTVRQPYAWAIAHGGKNVENRTSGIRYRGDLAIHAGLTWHQGGAADQRIIDAFSPYMTARQLANPIDPAEHHDRLRFGAVIAVVTLIGCHADDWNSGCCGPWGDTVCWHWLLADIRPLTEPVECKGKQGLWHLPDDVAAAVRGQIQAVTR